MYLLQPVVQPSASPALTSSAIGRKAGPLALVVGKNQDKASGQSAQSDAPPKSLFIDPFGRTGQVQVLHIELAYADGSKGEINLTTPGVFWSEDIETQWYYMRTYLKEQHQRLGIVRYHAHCAGIDQQGNIKKIWSWNPFDLLTNQDIYPA